MDFEQKVLNEIPQWDSEGKTFDEIFSCLSIKSQEEAKSIVDALIKKGKIEWISCGDSPLRYRLTKSN